MLTGVITMAFLSAFYRSTAIQPYQHPGGVASPDMLSAEAIKTLGRQMLRVVPSRIWERGYSYYREKAVTSVAVTETGITAEVAGTYPYTVWLDLLSFRQQSYCTCPYDGYCKHMTAVFFELYEHYGQPGQLIVDIRNGDSPFLVEAEHGVSENPVRGRRQEPLASPDGDLNDWLAHAEHVYRTVVHRLRTHSYYVDVYSEFVDPLIAVSRTWPTVKRQLHRLVMLCFLMQKAYGELQRIESEATTRTHSPLVDHLLQTCFRELMYLYVSAHQSQTVNTWVNEPSFWSIRQYLRSAVLETPHYHQGNVIIYQLLWMHAAHLAGGLESEIDTFQRAFDDLDPASPRALSVRLALATLLTLAQRDDEARPIARQALNHAKLAGQSVEDALSMLVDWVSTREDWPRLVDWLRLVTAHLDHFGADNIRRFTNYWMEARFHLRVQTECETFLRKGLPITSGAYRHYLYETGQIRRFVEFELLEQASPTDYSADFLKQLEQVDRAALLPWYHQAIERAVRRKNRESYKLAVRMMKKLRTHYKKLKQTDRWDRYLEGFIARHSRLRALQEEMRKKGLIS